MKSIKDGEEELINTLLKNVIEKETIMNKSKILSFILVSSCLLFADDKAEVENLVKKHYSYQNNKNWKKFVTTLSTDGTMNGDNAFQQRGWGIQTHEFSFLGAIHKTFWTCQDIICYLSEPDARIFVATDDQR